MVAADRPTHYFVFHAPDPIEARTGALSFARCSPFLSFPPLAFSALPFRSWVVKVFPVFGLIGWRTEWLAKTEKLRPVAMFNNSQHSNALTQCYPACANSLRSLVNFYDCQHHVNTKESTKYIPAGWPFMSCLAIHQTLVQQESCAIAKMAAQCADKGKQTAKSPPPKITWLS